MDKELKQYFDDKFAQTASKDDLSNFATKDDLQNLATRNELRDLGSKLDGMQETLDRIDKRDKEDSDAFASDILKHDRRITSLAAEVAKIKTHQTT